MPTNIPIRLTRVQTSEEDKVLLLLEEATSLEIHGWWYTTQEFGETHVKGGFFKIKLPVRLVSPAVMRTMKYYEKTVGGGR